MTTKTTQSAAILAQREKSTPNSILSRWRAANLLIANARLEFNASHSKHNLLKISNRERITIFHPPFCALAEKGMAAARPSKIRSSFHPRASTRQILIANLELEFRLTHRKLRPLEISNRKYFAIFYLASATKSARSLDGKEVRRYLRDKTSTEIRPTLRNRAGRRGVLRRLGYRGRCRRPSRGLRSRFRCSRL